MPRFSIFYGWWIVAVGVVCLLLAGGIGFYSFGAFFIPLINEFGWSRGQLSLAMTIACLVGLLAPVVGTWIDRYGVRRAMALGALLTGSAFALLGLTNPSWGPYALCYFYALSFIMALGLLGILNIPVATAVSNWFAEKRGLAMGIALTGFGLGGLVMLPLASYLITVLGWRMTYHVLGLTICIVLIPLIIFVIREKPEQMGLLPDGKTPDQGKVEMPLTDDTQDNAGWNLSSVLRTKTFWLIVGALGLAFLGAGSVLAHLIPFLQDNGLSHQLASTILALTIGVSVVSRVIAGYIVDRVPIRYVVTFCFLFQVAGLALLLIVGSMTVVWAFVIVFGLAIGGMFALEPLLVSRYFGLTSFGAIYGGVWIFATLGFAGGPPLAGYIFDATESYELAFIIFIAATLLAMVLISLVRAPQPPPVDRLG